MLIAVAIVSVFALCQGMIKDISFDLLENSPIGTVVGNIKLSAELLLFQQVELSLENSDNFEDFTRDHKIRRVLFRIDNKTDELVTVQNIDRETLCATSLSKVIVNCSILQIVSVNKLMWINVYIRIIDVNDNQPQFRLPEITLSISEISKIHSTIQLEEAIDLDSAAFGPVAYELQGNSRKSGHFQLQRDPLKLILLKQLDYEFVQQYQLLIIACDAGVPPLCGNQAVSINVINENDEAPVFLRSNYTAIINEDASVGQVVLQPRAVDRDAGVYGKVKYSISTGHHLARKFFTINPDTGDLIIKEKFPNPTKFKFPIEAKDEAPNPLISRTWILLHIVDINNNIPIIQINTIDSSILKTSVNQTILEVTENNKVPLNLAFITVTDADQGENARCMCQFLSAATQIHLISVNELSERTIYRLVSDQVFDAESSQRVRMSIACNDHGEPQNTVVKYIEIYVKDVNEYPPTFDRGLYEAEVPENASVGSIVSRVRVYDRDIRQSRFIDLTAPGSTYFQVNSSGVITTKSTFDYEKIKIVDFYVVAIDRGIRSFTSSVRMSVSILDINDNYPEFEANSNHFEVFENMKGTYEIGRVKAYDKDSSINARLKYHLLNTSGDSEIKIFDKLSPFSVDEKSGVIHSNVSLDYENCTLYILSIRVTDSGRPPRSNEQSVYVHVKDLNDNGPTWQYPNINDNFLNISMNNIRDSVVTRVRAVDPDGDQYNLVHYYLLSHKHLLRIDKLTGVLTLRSKEPPQPMEISLLLQAVDSKAMDKHSSQRFIIHIQPDQRPFSSISSFSLTFPVLLSVIGISSMISIVLVITLFFFCCRRRRMCRRCLNSRDNIKPKDCDNLKLSDQQKKVLGLPLDLVADKDRFNDVIVEDSVKLMFGSLYSSPILRSEKDDTDYRECDTMKDNIFQQLNPENAQPSECDYYRYPANMISLHSSFPTQTDCCARHSSSDEDSSRYTEHTDQSMPMPIHLFQGLDSTDCMINSYATFVKCDCALSHGSIPDSNLCLNKNIMAPFIFNGSAWIPTEPLSTESFLIHTQGDNTQLLPLKSIMKKTPSSFINIDSSSSSGQFNDTDQTSSAYDSGCVAALSDSTSQPPKSINLLDKTYQCKKSQV